MNREILFRGKRKDNGEWVEGDLRQDKDLGTCYIMGWNYYYDSEGLQREPFEYEVIPETIGQYTGLTDKNGKKIFEGDCCLLTKPCVMAFGIIKYEKSCYWFVENKVQTDGTYNRIRLCDLDSNGYEIRVKGNVHDNPELLEEVQG